MLLGTVWLRAGHKGGLTPTQHPALDLLLTLLMVRSGWCNVSVQPSRDGGGLHPSFG